MRGPGLLAFAAIIGLAACQPPVPQAQPTSPAAQKCADQTGFSARANALRAQGVRGDIIANPQEQVAIEACVTGKAPAVAQPTAKVPATPPQPAPAAKAAPAATPKPAASAAPARRNSAPLPPIRPCNLTLIGGTGYACSATP